MQVLADTSIWVMFLNNSDPKIVNTMKKLIHNDQLCICPPVYQEILQGVRTKREFKKLEKYLQYLNQIKTDPYSAAQGAAKIYFTLRKKGLSIRKSYDCLIAWYAIEANVPLYHIDRDFDRIATHFKLKKFTD